MFWKNLTFYGKQMIDRAVFEDFGGYFLIISGWRIEVSSALSTNNRPLNRLKWWFQKNLKICLVTFHASSVSQCKTTRGRSSSRRKAAEIKTRYFSVLLFFFSFWNMETQLATLLCVWPASQEIDFEGFKVFMQTFLESELSQEFCQHLFLSFSSKAPKPSPSSSDRPRVPGESTTTDASKQKSIPMKNKNVGEVFVKVEQFLPWTTFVTIKAVAMLLHYVALSTKLSFVD